MIENKSIHILFEASLVEGKYVSESLHYTQSAEQLLQCPHPRFDKGLMISGTHRCNSVASTSCSGTATACGASSPFRISDIAHNDESLFQSLTRMDIILFNFTDLPKQPMIRTSLSAMELEKQRMRILLLLYETACWQ